MTAAQVTATQATTATQAITQTTAPTRAAWVSSELVRIGAEGEVPVTVDEDPLLPSDLTANWSADWVCRSTPAERCNLQGKTNCTAEVIAAVTRPVNGTLLPVELKGTWDDEACGATEVWTQQVDQFNGKEAGGDGDNDFTSNYWAGVQPGDANGVLPLDDKRGVMVYCSGPHQQEIPGLDGWALVQEGYTCHDVKTGMLVYISFTSKYLFTGTLDGKDYEKAFFGDVTKLEQKLTDTNAGLAYVEAKQ
ncbi:MAG: hypothetical protein IPK16_06100 [Anaerolineales bacterium]|nr:hypothetical protein [Anaerolineales bacterium]